jgi:Spy/CpxP family protein refolding chaperone
MQPRSTSLALLTGLAVAAVAASQGGTPAHAIEQAQEHAQHSHYAGREASEIPSLTEDQLEQLRNGDGMGMALPAELNHYPGPKHVLELADDLSLDDGQRRRTEEIFAAMRERAQALGGEIIEAERHLNTRFEHGHIDDEALRERTAAIATLYGELRFTHLSAHLQMKELLSEEQVAKYDELRGYAHQ